MIDQGTDVLSPPTITPDAPTAPSGPIADTRAQPSRTPVEVAIRPDASPTSPAAIAPSIEAMLITSGRAVSPARLAEALGLVEQPQPTPSPSATGPATSSQLQAGDSPANVTNTPVTTTGKRPRRAKNADPIALIAQAIEDLNHQYAQSARAFRIELVAGGYRVVTIAQHAALLARFHNAQGQGRLSKASIETLAIIAYKQPITRARLEVIRGVASGEVLRSLLERRLINIAGRADELGRPMLYGTTKHFLEAFGLATLADLPSPSDFATLRRAEAAPQGPTEPQTERPIEVAASGS